MSPLSFIYQIIKPYRKWYILLCLGPIGGGFMSPFGNYVIKVIIDTIGGSNLTYSALLKPLLIFILIEAVTRISWSLHDYAEYKVQGNVFRDVIVKPYEYLQNHNYIYFQNNFSGSLISKLKGISDGFYHFWDNIAHRLLEPITIILINIVMIIWLAKEMFLPILILVFISGIICIIQSKTYDKLAFQNRKNWHFTLGKLSDKVTNILTILNFAKKQKETQDIINLYKEKNSPDINKLNYFNFISWLILGSIWSAIFILVALYAMHLRIANIIDVSTLTVVVLISFSCCREVYHFIQSMLGFISHLADFRASLDGIFIKQEIIDKENAMKLII